MQRAVASLSSLTARFWWVSRQWQLFKRNGGNKKARILNRKDAAEILKVLYNLLPENTLYWKMQLLGRRGGMRLSASRRSGGIFSCSFGLWLHVGQTWGAEDSSSCGKCSWIPRNTWHPIKQKALRSFCLDAPFDGTSFPSVHTDLCRLFAHAQQQQENLILQQVKHEKPALSAS